MVHASADLSPIYVLQPLPSKKEFSVVSLVVNDERYRRLRDSFKAKGFTQDNSEFFAIDNRVGNRFDGYSALRAVLPGLRGKHVLYTHDDIELTSDGIDELRALLEKLENLDPKWMIAGNAGGTFLGDGNAHFLHLDDPYGAFRLIKSEPVRVSALDENFLVMPRHRMPLPSLDLSGFHLFATDMCLQARAAGGSSYVIPFLLRHHGKGLVDGTFPNTQVKLERKYSRMGLTGRLQAPAITMAFGQWARLQMVLKKWRRRLFGVRLKS
jgi:hypothetical protein